MTATKVKHQAMLATLLLAFASPACAQMLTPPRPLAPLTMHGTPGRHAFVTEHTGTFNGHKTRYRATVAETIIENPAGKPAASLYTIAYTATNLQAAAARPVLFIFNGGPGGSSAFLHLGALGPKRLAKVSSAGFADPDNQLIDNPECLLDVADLVFIDPVDTGFSHTLPGVSPRPFQSVDGDSESIAQLIIQWLTANNRLGSPKYVYGESYGTLRGVALVRDLGRSAPKVTIDGLILGGQAITFGQGGRLVDPVRTANRIVMMASLAWHYGKIDNKGQTWEAAVDKARRFAREDYVGALMQGYRLDPTTRERIVTTLPGLIGIPESYFRQNRTITVDNFRAELLKDQGVVLDANNGLDVETAATRGEDFDAAFKAITDNVTRYLRDDLKVSGLGSYATFTPDLLKLDSEWDYSTAGAPALDRTLSQEMRTTPTMRLLVMQGRYDTLTQMGATEYTMAQTDLPIDRFHISYFDGGHYLMPTHEAMSAMRAFIAPAN